MPSFCSLFVEFRAVVDLLPPFIQFSQLDLLLDSGWLEIHIPPLNCPMGFELKFNWEMTSFAINQLVRCHSYRRLQCSLICILPRVVCFSICSPWLSLYSTECSWFACLIFLLGHSSGDGMVWQLGGLLPSCWDTSWMSCRWSVSLRHLSWLSELQSGEIWFPETFFSCSSSRPQRKEVLQPIWTHSPLPLICTRTALTFGRDTRSRLPIHRISLLDDCS